MCGCGWVGWTEREGGREGESESMFESSLTFFFYGIMTQEVEGTCLGFFGNRIIMPLNLGPALVIYREKNLHRTMAS